MPNVHAHPSVLLAQTENELETAGSCATQVSGWRARAVAGALDDTTARLAEIRARGGEAGGISQVECALEAIRGELVELRGAAGAVEAVSVALGLLDMI